MRTSRKRAGRSTISVKFISRCMIWCRRLIVLIRRWCFFFFQAEDGIRDADVTEFRRVLFRSRRALPLLPPREVVASSGGRAVPGEPRDAGGRERRGRRGAVRLSRLARAPGEGDPVARGLRRARRVTAAGLTWTRLHRAACASSAAGFGGALGCARAIRRR